MKKINIKHIKNDMILAQPVIGSNDNTLLGVGFVLNKELIPRLNSWGITHVHIITSSNHQEASAEKVTVSTQNINIQKDLEEIFQNRLQNEPMKVIYRAIKRQFESHDEAQ
ncbi:MAG: hypothetical protein GX801_08955 [Fibrobacter sp.]|nr:hypothetical protein [Fibrobacter sp.]